MKRLFFPAAAILIFALLLVFPLAFGKILLGRVPLFGDVPGVDFSVLALLAAGVVAAALPELAALLKRERVIRFFAVGSGLGCAVVLLQQFIFGVNLAALLSGFACFLVPLAGLLLVRELRRLLPFFLMTLFVVSAAITFRETITEKFAVGLAGNWNWNWTLLTVSVPAFAFFLRNRRLRLPIGGGLAGLVAFGQFLFCGAYASRGTLIASLAAGGWLILAGFLHRRPGIRKHFVVSMAVIVLVAGSVVYCGVRSGFFAERLPEENRLMLWQGSLALGEEHWLFGVGQDRFEGEVAPFLPESYFDSDFVSDRHPHPHNELLFYWCGFGVAGILWWLLVLCVGVRGAILRRHGDERTLLVLWGWWVLFFHGEIDVLLQTPLAGGLFLILTGMLAGTDVARIGKRAVERWQISVVCGFALLAVAAFCLNVCGGWYCRSGKLALLSGEPEPARRELRRSIAVCPTAENLYTLANVELFDFRNPAAAEEMLRRLGDELRLASYSHSAGRMARALAAGGKPEEALPFFAAEQKNFPRSAVNLILWQTVVRQLGRTAEADEMFGAWQELLRHKGITPQEFPYLMRNQQLDDSPLELRLFLNKVRK